MSDHVTTLTSDFQIEIPATMRSRLRWSAGQKVALIPKGDGVLLLPVPSWEELQGIAKGADPSGYRDRDEH